MSIDDKANDVTVTRRQNMITTCINRGIFYNPESATCSVSYPCEHRVLVNNRYTCNKYNPKLNPDIKPV